MDEFAYDEALKIASSAADIEDKTEKAPVTPGAVLPARELFAALLLEHGMAREALAAYEATLAKEPNRLNATLGAGAAAEKLGNSDKARQHYGAAVVLTDSAEQIRPQIAQARAFMACLPSPSPSPPTVAFAIARCLRPDARTDGLSPCLPLTPSAPGLRLVTLPRCAVAFARGTRHQCWLRHGLRPDNPLHCSMFLQSPIYFE